MKEFFDGETVQPLICRATVPFMDVPTCKSRSGNATSHAVISCVEEYRGDVMLPLPMSNIRLFRVILRKSLWRCGVCRCLFRDGLRGCHADCTLGVGTAHHECG